jgi:DNA-binding MarR family transcriptional regulator
VLARRFDDVFRPLGLTLGPFSLRVALNPPLAPSAGGLAPFLAMDRTTLTAPIKPLERRGQMKVTLDPDDRRKRRVCLTRSGHALLGQARPLWSEAHTALEHALGEAPAVRALLGRVATLGPAASQNGRGATRGQTSAAEDPESDSRGARRRLRMGPPPATIGARREHRQPTDAIRPRPARSLVRVRASRPARQRPIDAPQQIAAW